MSILILCLALLGFGPSSLRIASETGPAKASAAPTVSASQTAAPSARERVAVGPAPITFTTPVTMTAPNEAPIVRHQSVFIEENSEASVVLLASDPDGDPVTLTVVGPPAHGTVRLVGRVATYTADPDWNGADTLQFVATDSHGATSAPGSLSIVVYAGPGPVTLDHPMGSDDGNVIVVARIDHTPVATPQTIDAWEDTPISFALDCVEPDGEAVTYAIVGVPRDGSVALVGGTATYTPTANWEGMDTFTWACTDPTGLASVTTPVTMLVQPINDVPVATSATLTLNEDDVGTARLAATDVESSATLTYTIVTDPTHGILTLSSSSAQYRPNADFAGTDSFTFKVNDGEADSNIATISVTVNNVDDPPQAANSAGATTSGVPVELPAAYIDPDGPDVSVTLVSEAEYGTVSITDTTFLYTPPDDFMGVDTFTYSLTDPTGLVSDTVMLRVNIHPTPTPGRPEMPQFGLNFIQFGLDAEPGQPLSTASFEFQPDTIFDTFAALGVQSYRQSQNADLVWSSLQPGNSGDFADDESLEVLPNPDFEPMATLFERQYASPTPPWCTDVATFQRYMSHDAYTYLDHVIETYGDSVRYFDVGNEVYHWVASYPPQLESGLEDMPDCYAADGYYPSQQAVFLEEASRYLRSGVPDAVITLPAVNTGDGTSNDWLREVMAAAGDSDWFDVISYHSYNEWSRLYAMRQALAALVSELGLDHKMIKMTEGGSSSDPLRTEKTDYPNSEETQASDMFRLPLIAWGYGDAAYTWHSYIVADAEATGSFGMEVVNNDGSWKPAGYAMQLMTENLLPFTEVADFSYSDRYRFRINRADGHTRWVMWGERPAPVPEGVTEYTSVYPNADGSYTWIPVVEGESVTLGDTPILLR